MENDQVFEAERDVDVLFKMRSQSSQHSKHDGRDALQAALGGFETQKAGRTETTPLLSQEARDPHETAGDEDADPRGPSKWSGERDFEGLHWWKKPSVRLSNNYEP